MSSITVRPARPSDLALLCDFNRRMALETEDKELDPALLERGVRRGLADRARARYFVAELDGAVVGSAMLTSEWSDWRDGWFLWIQSVYTVPEARRRGVYRALYDALSAEARADPDVCGLRLYVENENAAAQAVYERLGMQRTSYRLYEVDFRAEDAADPARRSRP